MEENDITLIQPIRNCTFQARFSANIKLTPEAKNVIRWIGVIELEHKMTQRLWNGDMGTWAQVGDNKVKLVIIFHEGVGQEEAEASLQKYGTEVENYHNLGGPHYIITVPKEVIKTMASENIIQYIDVVPPPPTTE